MKKPSKAARPLARILMVFALAFIGQSDGARAEWPERTITIIVPFGRGGHTDQLGRLLAAELSSKLGQKVAVENRAGGGANVGLSVGARAASNGYTLVLTSNAVLINVSLRKSALDPLKEFVPVAYLGAAPNVVVTRRTSEVGNLSDLIAKAKANPGKLNYASPGVGTSSQLAVELLKQHANIDIRDVPFDGSGMALMAAISGAADFASLSTAELIGPLRSGELKALVQTGRTRWVELPDVPTAVELGYPNGVLESTQMLLAPRGTSALIIYKLSQAIEAICQQTDMKTKMLETGFIVQCEGPDELYGRMVREIAVWKAIIDRAGLKKE